MKKLLKNLRKERGRLRDLAVALSVSPATILTWKQVPPKYCLKIEEITGVSRFDLRPDVYGEKHKDLEVSA